MKITLTLIFLLCAFVSASRAEDEELSQGRLLFYQGNAHYGNEQFDQAIADYEEALSLGVESGPLYYNLGNAYFKHGSLGKAIADYVRAQRLMPQDADLKSNLDYARSLIEDGVVPQRRWPTRMFFTIAGLFSLNRITLLSAIIYFILSVLATFAIITKNARKIFMYMSGLTLVVLIVCLSLLVAQLYTTVIQKEAIVIAKSSDSKFEPFNDATTFFALHEGESVFVIASKKEWVKVRRIDGKQGWVKNSDMELL